jgi:hypothetical protein
MISNMNKILDGLYLGSFEAANDTLALKKLGITHILTAAACLTPYNVEVILKCNNLIAIYLDEYCHLRYA